MITRLCLIGSLSWTFWRYTCSSRNIPMIIIVKTHARASKTITGISEEISENMNIGVFKGKLLVFVSKIFLALNVMQNIPKSHVFLHTVVLQKILMYLRKLLLIIDILYGITFFQKLHIYLHRISLKPIQSHK